MADDAGAVAALDCGTNSTRLLIADGRGEILEREMRITRLGEAVDATHKLSADAIGRTVAVLRDYKTMMDAHGVTRARLVATSAARDAVNADEFFCAAEDGPGSPRAARKATFCLSCAPVGPLAPCSSAVAWAGIAFKVSSDARTPPAQIAIERKRPICDLHLMFVARRGMLVPL